MVGGGGAQVELGEDRSHVRLDGLRVQRQRLADRAVGASSGHQREDLALAPAEAVKRRGPAARASQALDHGLIERTVAISTTSATAATLQSAGTLVAVWAIALAGLQLVISIAFFGAVARDRAGRWSP